MGVEPPPVPPNEDHDDHDDPSIDDVKPFFVHWLSEHDADVGGDLESMFEKIRADGALPARYKSLLVMALDAAENHGKGVESNADIARQQGASEDEIMETLEVVTLVCGLQGLSAGSHAFDARGG